MKEINISKNIADLRKRKGITQEQLASALNISPQAISKWETNTSFPDAQTLPLIAAYFEVSIDYLFYGEDYAYNDIYNKVFDKVAEHAQMLSITEPVITFFIFVRTNAAPFPGLTCWNSIT